MSADGNQRIDDWLAHETPEAVLEPDLRLPWTTYDLI